MALFDSCWYLILYLHLKALSILKPKTGISDEKYRILANNVLFYIFDDNMRLTQGTPTQLICTECCQDIT